MQVLPPVRARHTYTQTLAASPDEVFPLLCPVREAEWVDGWDPRVVFTASGVAEQGCAWVMPGSGTADPIWVVTRHDPAAHRVSFVKTTPDHSVGLIDIALAPAPDGGSHAEITYDYTALSEEGRRFVRAFTAEHYAAFMKAWEDSLNGFLRAAAAT
jgi:hypothetical protein